MISDKILKKAIEKAIENGYLDCSENDNDSEVYRKQCVQDLIDDCKYDGSLYGIIFSHDFAKAFWGDKKLGIKMRCLCGKCEPEKELEEWMPHLQQMVLEKDKIKYIEKFLNDK